MDACTPEKISYLNDFDTIDYKRPIGKSDDTRTSTYRAHHYLNDLNMRNTLQAKLTPSKTYEIDHVLERSRKSDYQDNYLWPRLETGILINPKLGFKHKFIKPFDERKMKFLKRPIRPMASSSHEDYQWRNIKKPAPIMPIKMPSPVEITKITINRCKPGYSKYLDPSATTTRLDYCSLSPSELDRSIARHDNITVWNWPKIKARECRVVRSSEGTLCDTGTSALCPKSKGSFPSLVKSVPHSGMTTEVRENYLAPLSRSNFQVYDSSHIRNAMVHSESVPSPNQTDYRLLTSGERVEKYV